MSVARYRHPGEGRDPRTPNSESLDPGFRRDDVPQS